MGKTSNNSAPSFSGGNVDVNGQNVANTYKSGNNVYSNYNMSDLEKQIYSYAQNSFLENLPYVNVFSEETQKQMSDELNAYTGKGLNLISNMYTPMLDSLKTDVASRFGNFDNSVFMDNLNKIEGNRADSMSSLAQDILAKQSDLYNQELARRYDYLSFMNGIQNSIDARIAGYLGMAGQNSTLGNTYAMNAAKYNTGNGFNTSALYSNLAQSLMAAGNPWAAAAGTGLSGLSLFV
ncbi:MAG: hypothetical protein LBJ74_01545 [Heliobacteriaceae bacterium]|jgi:hypothetical protein|nr:hypothetical protein [Heliobacteriaceae bacterium]